MAIQRGDIYLVDFDPSKAIDDKVGSEILKKRPAVVLTVNPFNKLRRTIVVVPLSSSPRAAPPLVVAVPSAGPDSVAVCDQLTTINKETRLLRRMGKLAAEDLRAVEEGVRRVLGL
jgi:mRNA interferase MazF